MKRLSFCCSLIFFVQFKCTFVSSSFTLDTFKLEYTDKEYTSQVGNVSIAPLVTLNAPQLNTISLAQGKAYELIFDLFNPDGWKYGSDGWNEMRRKKGFIVTLKRALPSQSNVDEEAATRARLQ